MTDMQYIMAALLIVSWSIGFFVFSAGALIHVLLVVGLVTVLTRFMRRNKIAK
ncbi:MAG TPA: lmo0937 family membrane protein [Bacteroidia bacterium]|nr:lmo0937 family membrane protein [Bacteroidia bacterium]